MIENFGLLFFLICILRGNPGLKTHAGGFED